MSRAMGLILLAGVAIGGCAAPQPPSRQFSVPAGQYAQAFEAAKDVLRESEFELARVDARGGVVTTLPRQWAGFMTPWIPFDAEPGAAIDGFLNHERFKARVVFDPPGTVGPSDEMLDRREYEGVLTGRVEVTVERIQRPHRRVGAPSVRLSSFARDPEGEAAGERSWFIEDRRSDDALAGRLAAEIQKRAGATDQTSNN